MTINEIAIEDALVSVSSTNRLEVLLHLVRRTTTEMFWPTFILGWTSCDATWWARSHLLFYLRRHHAMHPGPDYLEGDARAFFDGLPDLVEVYRGCSRERVRGVSWTTDRKIAAGFARGHRLIPVPDPVIAQALIPKAVIFVVFTDRDESELVLDPRRLRRLSISDFHRDA